MRLALLLLVGCIPPKTEFVVVPDDTGGEDGPVDDSASCAALYADRDGDGYGDPNDVSTDCDTSGRVADSSDCDDNSSAVHPGAADACDGIDEDCSGTPDDGDACACDALVDRGHRYLFCMDLLDWEDALVSCRAYGYDLVTIGDEDESAFVYQAARDRSLDRWWIGLNDIESEDTFVWSSGEVVAWQNWFPGEPNDYEGEDEDCGDLFADGDNDQWNDELCSKAQTYICEAP